MAKGAPALDVLPDDAWSVDLDLEAGIRPRTLEIDSAISSLPLCAWSLGPSSPPSAQVTSFQPLASPLRRQNWSAATSPVSSHANATCLSASPPSLSEKGNMSIKSQWKFPTASCMLHPTVAVKESAVWAGCPDTNPGDGSKSLSVNPTVVNTELPVSRRLEFQASPQKELSTTSPSASSGVRMLRNACKAKLSAQVREDRLLHLLCSGRDCIDISLVHWALGFRASEDLMAFLDERRHICSTNPRSRLVKHLKTAVPSAQDLLTDHSDLFALDMLIEKALELFVETGNTAISYGRLEERLSWTDDDAFEPLRKHFSLPRLLACFSLFDQDCARQSCVLNARNFAAFGSAPIVRRELLRWQGGISCEPLGGDSVPATLPCGSEVPATKSADSPWKGEFLALADVLRLLQWPSVFAPHVGDFLHWAWQTPGLELGVRLTNASYAQKDVDLEHVDRSEDGGLKKLVARLKSKPGGAERIAVCRKALDWDSRGLGSIEDFAAKNAAWLSIQGEVISLASRQRSSSGESPQTSEGDEGVASESIISYEATHKSCQREVGPPLLFDISGGEAYHEACLRLAHAAPVANTGASAELLAAANYASEESSLEEHHATALGVEAADIPVRIGVREAIARDQLRSSAEAALQKKLGDFPVLRVHSVGPPAIGLVLRDCGCEFLLELDGEGNRSLRRDSLSDLLRKVSDCLASPEVGLTGGSQLKVVGGKMPSLSGEANNLKFVFSIGTPCSFWSTELLRTYASLPGVAAPLMRAVVLWSKACGVSDGSNGLLSTYSLLLMVVFYLQCSGILPVLPLGVGAVSGASHRAPVPPPPAATSSASLSGPEALGHQFFGFFRFFACVFRWDAWVISVRCGAPLLRSQKARSWLAYPICIEDPFESHVNSCRSVSPRGRRQLLTAIEGALRTLLAGGGMTALLASGDPVDSSLMPAVRLLGRRGNGRVGGSPMDGSANKNERGSSGDVATPAELAMARQDTNGVQVREWIVELDRSCGKPLGIDVDDTNGESLAVRCISAQGLLAAWNAAAEPLHRVRQGHRILEVNAVSGSAKALVQECRKNCLLRLRIRGS